MSRHRPRSAHRTARSPLPAHLTSVTTSTDALALTTSLATRHAFLHAAVLLDDQHHVRDLTPFTDREHHTMTTAVEWAWCMFSNDEQASKLLLLSVDRHGIAEFTEEDAIWFVSTRASFGDDGIAVLDWIRDASDGIHSLAYTLDDHAAWPTDPPALRAKIQAIIAANCFDPACPRHGQR